MPTDRERWDAKYKASSHSPLDAPDAFVSDVLDRLQAEEQGLGTALDLAAGRGRHALELARRGWRTTAWDVSPVGLAALARSARAAELAVDTCAVDLLGGERPADEPFELVVLVNFLDRGLFAALAELVCSGGHALVTTFTTERPGTKPPDDYCLRPGELDSLFTGEVVLSFERAGRAGVLVRY